ncbi:MAG: hypothetical protein H6662_12185 [Ardenticatenaceae bacterium]|nr:hypothetical protein [Ardenticatenaceae bacterium]MCB9005596.1 hypothetical protein [Ardenticatenaceae bacterium]
MHHQTYRRRRSRRGRKRGGTAVSSWIKRSGLDTLIVLLFLLAIFGLSDPFSHMDWARHESNLLFNWFVFQGGVQHLGGAALVVAVVLGVLRLRWRINHHQAWWARGCPQCGKTNLSRIHRTRLDKLLSSLGIPVRRYICRECHWQGARIDESRIDR